MDDDMNGIVPIPEPGWEVHGRCRGMPPALFYPGVGEAHQGRPICDECTVRDLCLATSLLNNEHFGMWGGMTERQRRRLRRRLRRGTVRWETPPA